MVEKERKPLWTPRVPKYKIRQLYQMDARGIRDKDLADEVGFALMDRCESFIEANQAVQGQVICPDCGAVIPHKAKKGAMLKCTSCGWSLLWDNYFSTIQGKQLSGAEAVMKLFLHYIENFPMAKSYQRKMLLIDQLIHGYHWHHKFGATRPVAINLIDGNLRNVIEFLDELHQGINYSTELKARHKKWEENSQSARRWVNKEEYDSD